MKDVLLRKSLVIGILILFVGAGVVPSISGNVSVLKEIVIENDNPLENFDSIPLSYTENVGQFPEEVLFKVHTSAATVYLCKDEIVSVFSRPTEKESEVEILSIVTNLIGANKDITVKGEGILPHHHNYYIGNDPDKWYTYVKNYEAVCYNNVYPGIDLRYYSNENSLKYDFIVSPDADSSDIRIQYKGIEDLFLTSVGDIQIDTNFGSVYEMKPFIYQDIDGIRQEIQGEYKIIEPDVFGFKINDYYDSSLPLIIDPTLVYSTYLGGTDQDVGQEIAVDASGNAYITGETASPDFPLSNPYQGTYGLNSDAFITKLHTSTNTLVYSTYLGGNNFDTGAGIDVDSGGFASVVGTTNSGNFPVFAAHFPNLNGVQDAFVARLDPNGFMVFCTYLGGSNWEWGRDISVDSSGISYIIGDTDSIDFPLFNAFDNNNNPGFFDMFISKFDPPGGILMYSSYLGGSNHDIGMGIDFDSSGNAYVTGYTYSTNFPVTPATAYDSSYNGPPFADICIAILDTVTGGPGSLSYGSYIFGQGDDFGYDVAVDGNGIFYVTGETGSTILQFFPVTPNAYQQFLQGWRDAFFFKLDPSLTPANQMLYCSYLGGQVGIVAGWDQAWSIELDSNNNAYIAGITECSDFPLVNPLGTYNGGNEAFSSLFDPTQSGAASLLDSTYIGGSGDETGYGIAIDTNDDALVTGFTVSTDFPTLNPYQATYNGLVDAFVTIVSPSGGVNNPPQQPVTPTGQARGRVGVSYPYTTSAHDPDGDLMRFGWDWNGNGLVDQWDDNGGSWYNSGQLCTTHHSWSTQGTYPIRVMAEDVHGAGSVWSNPLTVTMPRNRAVNPLFIQFLEKLLEQFPLLQWILNI